MEHPICVLRIVLKSYQQMSIRLQISLFRRTPTIIDQG